MQESWKAAMIGKAWTWPLGVLLTVCAAKNSFDTPPH
jgi:hypothetical protein